MIERRPAAACRALTAVVLLALGGVLLQAPGGPGARGAR